jgi:hypothetical protein
MRLKLVNSLKSYQFYRQVVRCEWVEDGGLGNFCSLELHDFSGRCWRNCIRADGWGMVGNGRARGGNLWKSDAELPPGTKSFVGEGLGNLCRLLDIHIAEDVTGFVGRHGGDNTHHQAIFKVVQELGSLFGLHCTVDLGQ